MTRTVVYFTDSDGFGGAEQALLTILAGLDRRFWQPVLMHHPGPGIMPLIKGARQLGVALQPMPPMPEGPDGARRVPALVSALRARRPQVFHANLTWSISCKYGLVAAILARVPAIVATHQLYVDQHWSYPRLLQQHLIAIGVHRYIAISREVYRQLCQHFQIPSHKLCVVHDAVALERFGLPPDMALRASLTRGADRPLILTTARLDKQKGHRYLLEAATLVPDAMFVLAGDGPERSSLEAQVRASGLQDRVVLLGFRDDIPELLACCDLVVLPSLFEGLGISLIESMAAGKPVVASAIGGIDEVIVHGESGLLVPPADPIALAQSIRRVLSDEILVRRLVAAGRERARREFSAETMVERVTQIYEEILDSYGTSHALA